MPSKMHSSFQMLWLKMFLMGSILGQWPAVDVFWLKRWWWQIFFSKLLLITDIFLCSVEANAVNFELFVYQCKILYMLRNKKMNIVPRYIIKDPENFQKTCWCLHVIIFEWELFVYLAGISMRRVSSELCGGG